MLDFAKKAYISNIYKLLLLSNVTSLFNVTILSTQSVSHLPCFKPERSASSEASVKITVN